MRCHGSGFGGRHMTSSVVISPGPATRAPAMRGALRRSGLDTATTPGRLRLLLVTLVILSLAWGVVVALIADQHASAAANVVAVSEPLSLDAEQIYQSLSDADATAANAFLSGGLEPAAARQRYNADIAQAAIRIQAASALVGSSAARTQLPGNLESQVSAAGSATGNDLATLSAGLPVYTGEVETARADNRLLLPLGAAYLREASTLLRGTLLPAASDIYTRESELLTSASARATGLPLHRVRRRIRPGHRLCALPLLAMAHATYPSGDQLRIARGSRGWCRLAGVAGGCVRHRQDRVAARPAAWLSAGEAFARADVAALQAHADESLTLIDNSRDDSYQEDFLSQQKLLGPGPGTLLAAVKAPAGSGVSVSATRPMRRPGTGRTRPCARWITGETTSRRFSQH